MRYFFLSANEILESGLLQSQFVKPIERLALYGSGEFVIINLHRPFGKKFSTEHVRVWNLPILVPFSIINFRCLFVLNELLTFLYALVLYFMTKRGDVICARSYVPGLIGFWLNKIKGVSIIFDPRSLYVHENVGIHFRRGSLVYLYWLFVEKRIILKSDRIVCVSKGQSDYYIGRYQLKSKKCIVIPCYSSDRLIISLLNIDELRVLLGYNESDVVIGYIGSLNNGWNNISLYKEYFKRALDFNYKVLIISQDKKELMKDTFFSNEGINVLTYNDKIGEHRVSASTLQIVDYGIVLLNETDDWFTRLTVKFVDYTSNGLPVIANGFVGEVSNILKEYNLLPSRVIGGPDDLGNLLRPDTKSKVAIRSWSDSYFSLDNVIKIIQ